MNLAPQTPAWSDALWLEVTARLRECGSPAPPFIGHSAANVIWDWMANPGHWLITVDLGTRIHWSIVRDPNWKPPGL
jgi:hypothetical protein